MTSCSSNSSGYTIIETLVAVSLLMFAVAAAASLSVTLTKQEEINARAARALNWQENAVRLYHLGLGGTTVSEITDVMPKLPQMSSLNIQVTAQQFTDLPAIDDMVDVADFRLIYYSDTSGSTTRLNVMRAVRY